MTPLSRFTTAQSPKSLYTFIFFLGISQNPHMQSLKPCFRLLAFNKTQKKHVTAEKGKYAHLRISSFQRISHFEWLGRFVWTRQRFHWVWKLRSNVEAVRKRGQLKILALILQSSVSPESRCWKCNSVCTLEVSWCDCLNASYLFVFTVQIQNMSAYDDTSWKHVSTAKVKSTSESRLYFELNMDWPLFEGVS